MNARDYQDLLAWKKALKLVKMIYRETRLFPPEEMYGIVSQLRRACVSVPSNIAEGQGRKSKGEFLPHLRIALGSLAEAETQILISRELGYLSPNQAQELLSLTSETGRLINGLIKELRLRGIDGHPDY